MNDTACPEQGSYSLHGDPAAEYWVLQPVNEHEAALTESEAAAIRALLPEREFCLITVPVYDWFTALSPWRTELAVNGDTFSGGGKETLLRLQGLLRELCGRYGGRHATVLAGYSLAGLFALWAAYECPLFSGVAAVSPSLWFPGWGSYAAARTPATAAVYLSLGDREGKTRNPVMATVEDALRTQHRLLCGQAIPCTLEWNPGNHFKDADLRVAKGIAWVLDALQRQRMPDESLCLGL